MQAEYRQLERSQPKQDQTECAERYALFRRAIVEREEQAWKLIYQHYLPLVGKWVQRTAGFASSGEDVDYFANRALQKFWTALSADKFAAFPDLPALLQYLKLCAHSVVIDAMRRPKTVEFDSLKLSKLGFETEWLLAEERQRFWQLLLCVVQNKSERLLLHHRYVLGQRPQEIIAELPAHFANVEEIYRLLQNILARLRRNQNIHLFCEAV